MIVENHPQPAPIINHQKFNTPSAEPLPIVLTEREAERIIVALPGLYQLVIRLIYGTGLYLSECLQLRVKDLDLVQREVVVCGGKEQKPRTATLPAALVTPLKEHVRCMKRARQEKLVGQDRSSYLTAAQIKNYPTVDWEWIWQYVFPEERPATGTANGAHADALYINVEQLRKQLKQAAATAAIHKPVTCITFRHAFASRLLEDGCDILVLQELLGHAHVEQTVSYIELLQR